MVSSSFPKLLFRRLLGGRLLPSVTRSYSSSASSFSSFSVFFSPILHAPKALGVIREADRLLCEFQSFSKWAFYCSHASQTDHQLGPAAIDYRILMSEDEFHKLADSTLYELQEKFEVNPSISVH
ncbi:hypothetical protein HPP92_007806 [Vanilla planifolia]|uniref:Uncharacterized protein n=1 Tax=Vanilla planifolia TaxID=51239 RepID=A0A835VB15_VANPL|nr:hypothetical protein HPP92_007806 [Vanilla planifolia]